MGQGSFRGGRIRGGLVSDGGQTQCNRTAAAVYIRNELLHNAIDGNQLKFYIFLAVCRK